MRKTLDEIEMMEVADALHSDARVVCPEESTDSCAYQYNPVELGYDNLRDVIQWPKCESCGCYLAVEWEPSD